MFETMAAWLMVEHLWERTFDDEGEVGYTRLLARTRKPYRTLDGWMAILPYNDKHWRNFFELIGRPEVLKDPRYATAQCPFAAHQRHVRHGRGADPLADHRRMGGPARQGADPNAPVARPGRPARRPAPGVAPACSRNTRTPAKATC
jgi:crotonobetainyl-CoA:carnitine CoA-transferase CaiB-like acyl-CoA transferase